MIISTLALTAAAASKWLIAAKVATAVGTVCIAAQPVADACKYRSENDD